MLVAEHDDKTKAGIECPDCGCTRSSVYYTRRRSLTINGQTVGKIVRRRICSNCGRKYVTTERVSG